MHATTTSAKEKKDKKKNAHIRRNVFIIVVNEA